MDLAGMHAALADASRLAIAQYLYDADATPGQLGERFGIPTNLMAHHLGALAVAGLVRRRRSEHDGRRQYVQLEHSDPVVRELVSVGIAARREPGRVLFVCTRNSARSKLASALWRRHSAVPCADAGTTPAPSPHRSAISVADHLGLALDRQMHEVERTRRPGDLVVTVCDHVQETWSHGRDSLHWSVPDPVPMGAEAAFRCTAETLEARISILATQIQKEPSNVEH